MIKRACLIGGVIFSTALFVSCLSSLSRPRLEKNHLRNELAGLWGQSEVHLMETVPAAYQGSINRSEEGFSYTKTYLEERTKRSVTAVMHETFSFFFKEDKLYKVMIEFGTDLAGTATHVKYALNLYYDLIAFYNRQLGVPDKTDDKASSYTTSDGTEIMIGKAFAEWPAKEGRPNLPYVGVRIEARGFFTNGTGLFTTTETYINQAVLN